MCCAQAGSDGTFQTAQEVHDARLVLLEQQSGEGKQHSLQRCLQASHGEIIYLIDADCMIDPATFQRCLSPLLSGKEQVVSGSFIVPLPEQRRQPFVVSQLSGLAYSAAKQPNYVAGLLGGNCVLTRLALQSAGEFTNPVTIGTDFDLSRRLLASGQRIRMQLLGWIVSEFPDGWSAYRRQQSRWLRNVFLLGKKYADQGQWLSSLRTALIGLAMLAVPFLAMVLVIIGGGWSLAGGILLLGWLLLFCQAFFARIRYHGLHPAVAGYLLPCCCTSSASAIFAARFPGLEPGFGRISLAWAPLAMVDKGALVRGLLFFEQPNHYSNLQRSG